VIENRNAKYTHDNGKGDDADIDSQEHGSRMKKAI